MYILYCINDTIDKSSLKKNSHSFSLSLAFLTCFVLVLVCIDIAPWWLKCGTRPCSLWLSLQFAAGACSHGAESESDWLLVCAVCADCEWEKQKV